MLKASDSCRSEAPDTGDVVRETRSAGEKLSAQAQKRKRFSELQSLKQNPVQLSVDKKEFLDFTRQHQANEAGFGTLRDLLSLLNLLASFD